MFKKRIMLIAILGLFFVQTAPINAAMVSTSEIIDISKRSELISKLEREEVQAQLTERGVDPQEAIARVKSMTDTEVAHLHGQIDALPAGGALSTVELLLIIIIIILLV